MNKNTLIQLFKAPYKRQSFIDNALLPTFQGKVKNLEIYEQQGVQEIDLTESEQNYAVSLVKYGEFQTLDEFPRTVELFEVIVNDNKQIERSRVGLGALVKKHIIGNNAILVNFAYQNPEKRSWRFSFIARDGVFQDGEMLTKDTHPKRYTYVFGEPEETYKTALDRFFVLANELEITINKIKDAFAVEAMSKAFFDEYRYTHYDGFVDYLMRSNFSKSAFKGNDKDVRDFVKKLLGRIVFLYFLQKKGWLGAKDTSYKDGDKNFMTNFFKKAGANDAFYANWLSSLFFDALNNERPNDDFTMPDGEVVKIPYLNGGLFEKESEQYDFITFPAELFANLFEFFDQYNFTIFESSPEDHTVAVDPEMLGHIFENLLEDNKDKGAFYTPKEIVHYMTQESLIEYLHTQIPSANRTELENFVKNKENQLSKDYKKEIDQKLDTVKICDPAIGSGAFPMGLLQEIFSLKERIAYELGYKVWSPATVKENIIQKSIYGVDIERGAVDIARLRFWLSLIVDEEMPKALPNLDYKIVVGNSLVSKFDEVVIEIDWEKKKFTSKDENFVKGIQDGLKIVSEKQKHFFESKNNKQKAKLKSEIRDLKLEILINQLSFNKASYLNKNQKIIDMGFGLKPSDHKKNVEIDLQVAEFDNTLAKLNRLKDNPNKPFNHFDWKLDFPEVLNPMVNENTGFDIVIGNPPYVRADNPEIAGLREDIINSKQYVTLWEKWDLMVPFYERSLKLLKTEAVHSFIVSNAITTSKYAQLLQQWIMDNYQLRSIDYFENVKVFDAGVIPVITIIKSGSELDHSFKIVRKNDFKSLIKQQVNYDSPNLRENLFKKVYSDSFTIKVPYSFLGDICYLSVGMVTNSNESDEVNDFSKEDLISDFKDISHPKEYVEGKLIKSYLIEKVKFIEYDNGRVPDLLRRPTFKDLYTGQKLLRGRVTPGVIDRTGIVCNDSIVVMKRFIDLQGIDERSISTSLAKNNLSDIQKNLKGNEKKKAVVNTRKNLEKLSEQFSLEYLLGVINSKYAFAYLNNFRRHRLENYFYPDDFRNFPIPNAKIECQKIFDTLVIFLHLIKRTPAVIINQIPNSHISEAFEEVIDALVFELYFPEEFAEKGIEIEKYAQDIFKPIDNLSEEEQIKAIQEAYQTLREKKNPLRNQILLMQIELKELLNPILSL